MRRGISILLALVFGLGPLSATLPGAEDAGLPPCCRRHGAHHCAMAARMAAVMAALESNAKTSISAPVTCPLYPGASIALLMPAHALLLAAEQLRVSATVGRVSPAEDVAGLPGRSRTHEARGPPSSLHA